MKLIEVIHPRVSALRLLCRKCGSRVSIGIGLSARMFADIEGESFKDYYCEECAKEVRNARQD